MMFGVFDDIAYQGPLILTIVVAVQLASSRQWPFFVSFLAGFWLNNRLNEGLKDLIREPRPKPFDLNRRRFGMGQSPITSSAVMTLEDKNGNTSGVPFDIFKGLKGAQMRDPLRVIRRWWSGEDGLYLSRAHLWGMPSGHAQMASFVLAFYYFVRGNYLQLGSLNLIVLTFIFDLYYCPPNGTK